MTKEHRTDGQLDRLFVRYLGARGDELERMAISAREAAARAARAAPRDVRGPHPRRMLVLLVLLALLGATALVMAQRTINMPVPPERGFFLSLPAMDGPRERPSATLLCDGRVLVAGGRTADIWDPTTHTFEYAGRLTHPRRHHTAVLLADCRVLLMGGVGDLTEWGVERLDSVEIWDPAARSFRATGDLPEPRSGSYAELLPDGRALVSGGTGAETATPPAAAVWDPATDRFLLADAAEAPDRPTGIAIDDGFVLDVAGLQASTWDPSSGAWTVVGSLREQRSAATWTRLADGRILVTGGIASDGDALDTAEILDPTSGASSLTGSLTATRALHTALRLVDGRVLVIGDVAPSFGGHPRYAEAETAEVFELR